MYFTRNRKSPKIVISGYYGFDNCGDEAVLLAMVHCLRKLIPDVRIVVLSGNTSATKDLYDVDAVNRWNPIKVAFEILSCKLFISGGGSLLQDVTSSKSPLYYLAAIRLAEIFGKRVMIYSQGIGPLTAEKNRARISKTLSRCHKLTVRDDSSAKLLRELGIEGDIYVTCDPVMALGGEASEFGREYEWGRERVLSILSAPRTRKLLMVSIRPWGDNHHYKPIAEFLDSQVRNGWDVLLVPAHYPGDMESLNKISSLMTEQPIIIDKCITARQFLMLTAQADRVFSMRLHGLICAFAAGTPMLGLSYDPKVGAFMSQAGLSEYCLDFDTFDSKVAEGLLARIDDMPTQLHQEMETCRKVMQDKAWETAKMAAELLQ